MAAVPRWVYRCTFYQIMPDRFCNGDPTNDPPGTRQWGERPTRRSFFGGDLQGIEQRLGYLQGLGVDALYLTPIFAAPSPHKYDTADYLRIDPAFGSQEDFRRLLGALHEGGMHLILDGVFNHSGDRHWAFMQAEREGPDSPTWDWYHFAGYPVRRRPRPNYAHAGIYYLPKWNLKNPSVTEYLLGAVRHWTAQGIDGWRLDVPWYVEGHDFWKAFNRTVREINPEAYLVGEHWGDPSPWLGEDQFDGATDYRLREALIRFLRGQTRADEAGRTLEALATAYPSQHRLAMWNLVGSHDTPRVATVFRGNAERIQAAFTVIFTFPGLPLIYYGDEVGLRGRNDPGCRRTFPWEDEASWDRGTFAHVQRLARIRRDSPALQEGSFRLVADAAGEPRGQPSGVIRYVREAENGDRCWVAVSNGAGVEELKWHLGAPIERVEAAVSHGPVKWARVSPAEITLRFGREAASVVFRAP
ncbi:MAG: glycoside hydrolase family 13 protein [Bacillota bacterium]